MKARDYTLADLLYVLIAMGCLIGLVLLYPACDRIPEPASAETVHAAHKAELAQCRADMEKQRDAGPDAMRASYKECADKADRKLP